MIKQNQQVINFPNITSDAALIFCSFYFALYVRFEFLHGHTSLELFSARCLLIVAGYSLLLVLVYAALRMYGSYRFKEPGGEIATILLVNTVAVLGFMALLIDLRAMPLDNLGWAICKRGMDIAGSFILIILTSPLMLFTAIGVKLSSPGPVLFKQERIGKDRKPFQMLKFRSMRMTGTEQTGWSTDADPRKTRFGSFIRKYSIDETMQFFNVLKGDMSLVGPRPEIPYHVRHFKEEIPLYLVRQQVRPGMTGWTQVHGLRADTSIEERVKYESGISRTGAFGSMCAFLFKTLFSGWVNRETIFLE